MGTPCRGGGGELGGRVCRGGGICETASAPGSSPPDSVEPGTRRAERGADEGRRKSSSRAAAACSTAGASRAPRRASHEAVWRPRRAATTAGPGPAPLPDSARRPRRPRPRRRRCPRCRRAAHSARTGQAGAGDPARPGGGGRRRAAPGRAAHQVQSAEPSEEEGEAHRLGVALRREARHRLDHPRALTEALEVLAQTPEWLAHVEVVHPDQRSPLAFEADQVAPGEQLQRPGEPRADPARAPGDGCEAAVLAGEERDEPIVLAEVPGLENDPLGSEERHLTASQEVRW